MLIVTYLASVLCLTMAVEYSRIDEGYPQGFLSHCPGSWKAAIIRPETLKKLHISVYGDNRKLLGTYDYYHIDNLAKNPRIDFRKKTVLWNGGYLDPSYGSSKLMSMSYVARGYNFLSLDMFFFTASAARFASAVGRHTAEMLVKLTAHGLDPKKLELVGMSLGAQTMSFVAKSFRLITGQNVSLLTTLDPTGVCFRQLGPDRRLDRSDADFVTSIVTNMNIAGVGDHNSHLTFYVNGGEFQPGHIAWLPCDYVCSHFRAILLWMAALLYPRDYIGVRCDTVQQAVDGNCSDLKPMVTNTMGPLTDLNKPGIYYLRTSNRWPFALGKQGLEPRVIMSKSALSSSSVVDILNAFIYHVTKYFKTVD
ncbi:phospholipase A1 member A-like isoform X2 [Leguminivora glycinivorella]|uniref:phospholipase A1 member A-like isoform X2 n=1 Tax=Leguminivora glycinivorella TaxID=1035111 RepID=UPI00200CB7B7|nr:phospholipase A1 member A-like isoform X2 [Leguminivora glycinivorella]